MCPVFHISCTFSLNMSLENLQINYLMGSHVLRFYICLLHVALCDAGVDQGLFGGARVTGAITCCKGKADCFRRSPTITCCMCMTDNLPSCFPVWKKGFESLQ